MIGRKNKLFSLILGLITAVVLVASQFSYVTEGDQMTPQPVENEPTTKDAGDNHQETYLSIASFTLAPSITLHAAHEAIVIFEVALGEEPGQSVVDNIPVFTGKLFHTLFRLIISPNAP